VLLSISALISLIGTSWPLITKAVGKQMEALKPEFYNQVHILWIVITAIVLAAAPMLTWRGMSLDQALERLTKSWLAAVATGFVLFFLGFREPITLLICTLVAFTAYANAGAIGRRFRASRLTLGGFITHLGLALAILGLILSYGYERKERVVIMQGQDTFAMGYKWRYLGMTGNEKFPGDPLADKFNRVRIEIASHDEKFVVEPRFYQDRQRETGNNVVWPAILRWWDHDLYVSFFAPPQIDVSPLTLGLHAGEKGTVEGYTIEFLGFQTGGAMGAEGFRAIAKARVSHPNWKQPVEVEPFRMVTEGGVVPIPVALPDGAQILVGQMDVNRRLVQFQLVMVPNKPETAPRWVIPLEVYYKPFTILVWLGPPLTLLGGLMATLRRARDVRYGVARTTGEPFPTPTPKPIKPRGRTPRRAKEPVTAHSETHASG
jgi:cytochrome c-type biogenesis protein CcmF